MVRCLGLNSVCRPRISGTLPGVVDAVKELRWPFSCLAAHEKSTGHHRDSEVHIPGDMKQWSFVDTLFRDDLGRVKHSLCWQKRRC